MSKIHTYSDDVNPDTITALIQEINRSPDETPVSCVIVSKGKIIGRGHTRFPKRLETTEERLGNDVKSNYTIHAEVHAVMDALKNHPDKLKGATVLVMNKCICNNCALLMIEHEVGAVVCPPPDNNTRWTESNRMALSNLLEANILIDIGKLKTNDSSSPAVMGIEEQIRRISNESATHKLQQQNKNAYGAEATRRK